MGIRVLVALAGRHPVSHSVDRQVGRRLLICDEIGIVFRQVAQELRASIVGYRLTVTLDNENHNLGFYFNLLYKPCNNLVKKLLFVTS
jgi:hypothetical protein